MAHIIVNEEQAKIIHETSGTIEVRDAQGNRLGFISANLDVDEIAIAKARIESDEPKHTTQEVLDYLQSLEKECPALPSCGRTAPLTNWQRYG